MNAGGIMLLNKEVTDIGEQLKADGGRFVGGSVEDLFQGGAGLSGPLAADYFSDGKQRNDEAVLAH